MVKLMRKLLIIADDFTGALDSAVQFAKMGVRTYVSIDEVVDYEDLCGKSVISLNTESRHLTAKEAYDRVRDAVSAAEKKGFDYYYKKVDSTLRGNIGAELNALLDALDAKKLIFAPAYPAGGRLTKDGVQYCGAEKIENTFFAHDPFNPIYRSDLRGIIAEQTDVAVRNMSCDELLCPLGDDEKKEIIIVDAQTDAELERIGAALSNKSVPIAAAGSAGLAQALAKNLPLEKAHTGKLPLKLRRAIFFVGSVNQIALDQLDAAQREGYSVMCLSDEQKLSGEYWQSEEKESFISEISELLDKENCVIVASIRDRSELFRCDDRAQKKGISVKDIPIVIAESFGRLAKTIFDKGIANAFVVFGGDTFCSIVHAIGGKGVTPLEEIGAGTVYSSVSISGKEYIICSKAGGFGGKNVIKKIKQRLDELPEC